MRFLVYSGIGFSFCLYCVNVPVYATYYDNDGANLFAIIQGAIDLAINVFLMVLPIPVILSLQMSTKKKLGVVFIFMHGVFALTGSVSVLYYRTTGTTMYCQTAAMISLTVENSMTIVSSSMHACAAYLKKTETGSRLFGSLRSRLSGSHATRDSFQSQRDFKASAPAETKQNGSKVHQYEV